MRYVVDVRYDGTGYSGWQAQGNAVGVQTVLNKAIETLLRHPVDAYGAGRTDAGVHALQMPAHFDHEGELHPHFLRALNAILPPDISVMRVYPAPSDAFHARFSAKYRAYRYQMIFKKNPFHHRFAYFIKESLDVEAMQRGAAIIGDYNSFESFCKAGGSNKTFFCKIMDSGFEWEGDMLVYHVKADRFLRGMVRTIMGTLLLMGKGKLDEQGLRRIIEAKDRKLAGTAVFPGGLFLSEVGY